MFITRRDPEALELIRHDAAHVLAEAVQALYPGTQVTIGPSIENGFYYDFARNEPFTPEDFPAIEAKMREIVGRGATFVREEIDRDAAIAFFQAKGEKYKAQLIQDLPGDRDHQPVQPGRLARPLPRPAHALHRRCRHRVQADEGRRRLLARRSPQRHAQPRIYGTAWRDQKELDAYLHQLEEAERRDHRKIGKEMDLFHIQEEAVGSIFWHPKGWKLYRTVEAYMRRRLDANGYQEVKTPQLVDRSLWEKSGHWENYRAEHVHRPGAGRGQVPRAEADELPLPHPDLPPGHAVVSRTAAAHGGVRLLPPL